MREVLSNPPVGVCHFLSGNFGMVEDFSQKKHHFGKRRELGAVHAADPHGHQPCGLW